MTKTSGVAALLQVTPQTIRNCGKTLGLTPTKIGNSHAWAEGDIEKMKKVLLQSLPNALQNSPNALQNFANSGIVEALERQLETKDRQIEELTAAVRELSEGINADKRRQLAGAAQQLALPESGMTRLQHFKAAFRIGKGAKPCQT